MIQYIYIYIYIYTVSVLTLCAIIYYIFYKKGLSFIYNGDGLNQHYVFLRYYGQYLRDIFTNIFINHSFSIPMWDFSIGQGADILSTMHYYVIGDPLTIFSVFVKPENTKILYQVLIIARLYLAGLTFSLFCFKINNNNKKGTLIGALSYVFCGFALYAAIRHPYFINPMIYLPLLLLGAEKILNKEKPYLFIIMVFLSAVSNFYFLYSLVIITIIYVVVRNITLYNKNEISDFFKVISKFALYGLIGIMLSMIILLPVINLFLSDVRENAKNDMNIFYSLKYYAKFFMSFDHFESAGYWTYTGYTPICIFVIFLLFIKNKSNDIKKGKIEKTFKILFIIFTIFLCLPVCGHILNGFSYVSNRWIWAHSFVICIIISIMWNEIFNISKREKILLSLLFLLYLIGNIIIICYQKKYSLKFNNYQKMFLILDVIYVCILVAKNKYIKLKQLLIFSLVIFGLILNSRYKYDYNQYIEKYMTFEQIDNKFSNTLAEYVKEIQQNEKNKEFYRYTSMNEKNIVSNEGIYSNVYGISYYLSMQNGYISRFLYNMNNLEYLSNYNYQTLDGRTVLNELASVKYVIEKNKAPQVLPFGYEIKDVARREKNKFYIYENKYFLPMIYSYDSYIKENEFNNLNTVQKQEIILKQAVLEDDIDGYNKEKIELKSRELDYSISKDENIIISNNEIEVKKSNSEMILNFENVKNSELYFEITGLDYLQLDKKGKIKKDQAESYISNPKKRLLTIISDKCKKEIEFRNTYYQFYNGRKNFAVNLGYSEKSRNSITVKFNAKGKYYFDNIKVMSEPMNEYEENIENLKEDNIENTIIKDNYISSNIKLSKKKIVCFSIPYSEGWRAKVDGKQTKVYRANGMYMAILAEKGNHTIELFYTTCGLNIGAIISCVGIILFIILIIYRKAYEKKKLNKVKKMNPN